MPPAAEPTTPQPPAAQNTQYEYSFSITANRTVFYTEDATPKFTIDPGTIPSSIIGYAGTKSFYLIDLDTQEITNSVGDLSYALEFPRFYSELSKSFKAVFADNNQNPTTLDQLTGIVAESNEVEIARASWEVSLSSSEVDHIGSPSTIYWTVNQSLRESLQYSGIKNEYAIYLENTRTGKLIGSWQPHSLSYGTSQGYFTGPHPDEETTDTFKAYIAKSSSTASQSSELENIQAMSDALTIVSRKWGIALGEVTSVSAGSDSHYVKIPFTTTREGVKRSKIQSLYLEDTDTGRIIGEYKNPEDEGRTWIDALVDRSVVSFRAHIAPKGQTVEYRSQLQGIKASSNEPYPVKPGSSGQFGYLSSGQFQNGSNPSTADCEQQCYGDPINALNGELFENEVDLQIEGAIDLNFVRSYSSFRSDVAGPLGRGTTFSYNMALEGNRPSLADSDYITVHQENGSTVVFSAHDGDAGNKLFVAPNGVRATLSTDSQGGYILTRSKTLDRFSFDASGRLLKVTDRLGNEATLSYSGDKLASVGNGVSTIVINWSGELISSISSGPHMVSYGYTAGNLTSVQNSKITASKAYSYNSANRVESITHPNGGTYVTSYDSEGRAVSQTDPRGGTTTFEYQAGGYSLITLPNGEKTREEYSPEGKLVARTLAYGTTEAKLYSYSYQPTGEMATETLPGNKKVTYRYDGRGNLSYISNSENEVYRFEYSSLNLLTNTIDPLGRTSTNEYDSSGKLLKSVGYDGAVATFEHNSKGMLTTAKDPNGQVSGLSSSYSYSSLDLLSSTTDTLGNTTNYSYSFGRNPSKITDALGNETEFSYANSNGDLLTEVSYEDGSSESFSYDAAGRKIEAIAKDGTATQYSYDLMDNLLTVTTVHGTTSYEYDANQKLIAVTNPKGARVEYEYNALGLPVKEKLPGNRVKLKEYTVEGLLSAETDANGNRTTYGYSYSGKLSEITDPLGQITSLIYDKLGNLTRQTLPSGNWTSYRYDAARRLISTNENDLRKTAHSYDSNGNLTKTTYADGTAEARSYDSEDALKKITARDGKITSYSYDALGRTSKEVRPDSSEISYGYDSSGNMLTADYGDGYIYENSYNLKGQLLESTTPEDLTTEHGYNPAGELTSRGPPQKQVGYSYNSYGEITAVSYPSGRVIDYSYDEFSNLTEAKSAGVTLASYGYDSSYNLTSSTYGNGVVESSEFDSLNRLKKLTVANGGSELYSRSLEFNTDSQISRTTTNYEGAVKQHKTYQYSPLGTVSAANNELTGQTQNFSYDLVNNLKSLGPQNNFSYSGNTSQLGSSITATGGFQSYSYDGRGNRILANTVLVGSSSYAWSKSDKLKSVTINSPTAGNKTVDYGYDSAGLLSSRSVTGGSTEQFSWDTVSGSIPVLLQDGSFDYVYGAESTPFLQINRQSGALTYLHGDERNSVVLATDGSGGALWHRDYDEYGAKLTQTPASGAVGTAQTRFGYAGEYLDPDTQLYNLRARWYDPKTAAFLSVDPAVNLTGEKYSYGSGNPLSNTDPLGLWSMSDTGTSVAAAVDGFIGFPVAAGIMNSISPGSVDECSALYMGIGAVAMVGSLFIPGFNVVKGVSVVGKIAWGASKKLIANASKGGRLKDSADAYRYRGGLYGDLDAMYKGRSKMTPRIEINHIPAKSMRPSVAVKDGPAIAMARSDHMQTRTYGGRMAKLKINEAGLPTEELVRRDINDVLTNTEGGRRGDYNIAIREMLNNHYAGIQPREFGL